MKKLYAALLTVGLSVPVFAAQVVPSSDSEKPMVLPAYAGISTCEITSSTGTTPLLCTSGSGIILDIVASSMATTDAIVIRDSNTANTTSTVLYSITSTNLSATKVFPRFKNGLAVNALVTPTIGVVSRPNWTIVYTKDLY